MLNVKCGTLNAKRGTLNGKCRPCLPAGGAERSTRAFLTLNRTT